MLIQGETITATAKAVGVSRKTMYRWIEDRRFAAELERERNAIRQGLRARFSALADPIYTALEGALESKDGAVALRLAEKLGVFDLIAPDDDGDAYDTSDLSPQEAIQFAQFLTRVRRKPKIRDEEGDE